MFISVDFSNPSSQYWVQAPVGFLVRGVSPNVLIDLSATSNNLVTISSFDTPSFSYGLDSNAVDKLTSKGVFTAPVSGIYHFTATFYLISGSAALRLYVNKPGGAITTR